MPTGGRSTQQNERRYVRVNEVLCCFVMALFGLVGLVFGELCRRAELSPACRAERCFNP